MSEQTSHAGRRIFRVSVEEQDLTLTVCGHRLRVRWFAPRQSPLQPVIVLLHEGLGSVTQWRTFPQRLAAATRCAVVAYDRFGHGASQRLDHPRQAGFLKDEAEQALPELLDGLGIGQAILFGHSDGGSIALLFAAAYPERTVALISEASHVFAETDTAQGFADVLVAFETGDLRARLARHHGENVDSMFRGWIDVWSSPAMRDWRITDRLAMVRCPVLVIQGENDDHCSPAQAELIAAGVRAGAEYWIVPNCGHAPHIEATDAVAERAAAFIRRFAPLEA
jgi:pimeloyl-ACP methyl ester carboxylesterase